MTSDGSVDSAASTAPSSVPSLLGGQWRKFGAVLLEPWTLIMLLSAVILFWIGQGKLAPGANALVQTLLAVVSGVLGGRIANQMAEVAGQSILVARGRVAVRGLRLMLVQTGAFERRLAIFLDRRQDIEKNPDLTERNYEEAIEFCRRIQEEATSAIETWTDVLPGADLSSLIGRITELSVSHDQTKNQLDAVQAELDRNLVSEREASNLRRLVRSLERSREAQEGELQSLRDQLEIKARVSGVQEPGNVERALRIASYFRSAGTNQIANTPPPPPRAGHRDNLDSDDKK